MIDAVGRRAIIFVSKSEGRSRALAQLVESLAPDLEVIHFPPWDCLPFDRMPPSRAIMGERIVGLHRLATESERARLVITSPDALVQRVPPRCAVSSPPLILKVGDGLSPPAFEAYLTRAGYVLDRRVDEPGEAALRGKVIDIFPAGAAAPVRIEHHHETIVAIRSFDPNLQLTGTEAREVTIYPTVEYSLPPAVSGVKPGRRSPETLFDYLPKADLVIESDAEARRTAFMTQIADARQVAIVVSGDHHPTRAHLQPPAVYLDEANWSHRLSGRNIIILEKAGASDLSRSAPSFVTAKGPDQAFRAFVAMELKAGRRVVLTGSGQRELGALLRRLKPGLRHGARAVRDWRAITAAPPALILACDLDLDGGFVEERARTTVIAATDLFGSRARHFRGAPSSAGPLASGSALHIGDAVIHLDHGMGVLRGLEMVETSRASRFDAVALEYAQNEKLLVPVDELDRIWRYGAADAVVLDRLGSDAWPERRARLEAEIAQTAQRLLAIVRERDSTPAPRIEPPRAEYERFISRFPFSETPDQLQAIADALNDLASGKRMDRLVCGDVGFGKTEVALRAAAAAAFAGKQVAVIAPTTVLVKQHVQTFQQRFAGFGVKVAALSRLVKTSEAREVKEGLAGGNVRIVIGTHALFGRGIAFKDLGLLIIDEEQRFGAAQKGKLRKRAACVHALTLTATPIPRTLQAALVGLQQMSIIATPPAERRAIRTLLIPFEEAAVREALMGEHRRGGQSFVVCPRIEDLAPMETRLTRLVPSLDILVAHGKMSAEDVDRAMLRFANGRGDVLLATNIIESGLDLPSANTMLVWRADRFGLAQLHQLRGRVGRGRVRGIVYLLTDPEIKLGRVTRKRLETIEGHYHLGSGFAISSHDLDLRGAGDLLGEDQAGHIKLIGAELYRWLLDRALLVARGSPPAEEWSPELNLGLGGWIPADYVPEEDLRIEIYARLTRLVKAEEMEALRDEVEDRFGPLPRSLRQLFVLARVKAECRQARIARIDAGPHGIALGFQAAEPGKEELERLVRLSKGALSWVNGRLVCQRAMNSITERERLIVRLVARLASDFQRALKQKDHSMRTSSHESDESKGSAGEA